MTLYTPMPLELVLQSSDEESEEMLDVWCGDVRMQVVPTAPGIGRIVRLLECALDDYLNPAFTPGSYVRYSGIAE